jgi:single-strand DNA-binding protein
VPIRNPSYAGRQPIANLPLVTDDWRETQSIAKPERTQWHPIVIFIGALAKVAEQYRRNGATVYFEGQFTTCKWTDQGGVERCSTEIVLCGFSGTS